MQKNIQKYSLIAAGLVVVLLVVSGGKDWKGVIFGDGQIVAPQNFAALRSGNREMQVHFLDVGQGDAIYIRTPEEIDILIDGGPDKSVLAELGKVMPFWDHEIDMMILSHPHDDHVTGLVEVLRRYKVKQVYYTGALHTTDNYLAWLKEIKDQNIPMFIVKERAKVKLGDAVELEFFWPNEDFTNKKVTNLNNTSIVSRLCYLEVCFLLMGDAEKEVEEALLRVASKGKMMNRDEDEKQEFDGNGAGIGQELSSETLGNTGFSLRVDVLKAGHHGSATSSTEELLQLVKPEWAVIQVGKDNDYGHPNKRVLSRLERMGTQVLRNDLLGTITLKTDGQRVWREE